MAEREKKIYRIALIVAVAMLLYSPWQYPAGNGISAGYHFIWSPRPGTQIDFIRLIFQWIAVGAVALGVAKLGK